MMDGTIGVDSREGHGSKFWFTAVFELAPEGQRQPETQREVRAITPEATNHQARSARILVVEDNSTNRDVALAQLQKLGYSSTAVANGAQAVQAVADGGFDLVLMDCQMPVMDGFEATHRIRAFETGSRRLPIVAVTADAMSDDRDRCVREGMDDYLSKPVELGPLQDMLTRWLPAPVPATRRPLIPSAASRRRPSSTPRPWSAD